MELVKTIYERTDTELKNREAEIQRLREELKMLRGEEIPYVQIQKEISLSYPQVEDIYISRGAFVAKDSLDAKSCILVVPQCTDSIKVEDKIKLEEWLKLRLASENVVLIPMIK